MPELDWISIWGFKSIAKVEKLALGAINIVIGPNGAGKSNFIQTFAFLHAVREGRLQQYVARAGGAEKLLYLGSKTTKQIQLHLSFQGEQNQYQVWLDAAAGDTIRPTQEAVYFWNKNQYPRPYNTVIAPLGSEAGISGKADSKVAAYVRSHLTRWRVYHFHDTSDSCAMKKTSEIDDVRFLRSDASNIAAFIYLLQQSFEPEYTLIRDAVRRVMPFFDDFQLAPSPHNEKTIKLEWRHKGSDAYFDAASLSDGTIRFIALATLLMQPFELRPSVILVDEPELGLHPAAITLLAAMIRQASVRTQVIVSTQSSLLLDHFSPEEVLVAERGAGGTEFRRLSSEKLDAWLEDYSLGQLWEKNELGGRPEG